MATGDTSQSSRPPSVASSAGASGSSRLLSRDGGALARGLCAFWLGGRCYGLDVTLVGGVVQVDGVVPVPRAAATVIGLFNLRGAAVPLVDLALVLDLPAAADADAGGAARPALALSVGGMRLAVLIDRMEGVFKLDRGEVHAGASSDEHPAVQGLFTVDDRPDLAITILSCKVLEESLRRQQHITSGTGR